jgi:phage host-nuclease inhibitor protein Gam
MLKQARAFGVGMVLATQNPVDLDYKALSNAGTWFIGRLQTERDKARLLDGLDSAAANSEVQFDRGQIENIISRLGNRVFLMNNAHDDKPEIFQTRWALSYLAGPLARDQIKKLMDPLKALAGAGAQAVGAPAAAFAATASQAPVAAGATQQASLPPDIQSFYVPCRGSGTAGNKLIYAPKVLGAAKINFSDSKARIEITESKVYFTPITDNAIPVTWDNAEEINVPATDLEKSPQTNATFGELPSVAMQSKNYTNWSRDFNNWLYGTQKVELFTSPSLKEVSKPDETEAEFRIRLQQLARERRDEMSSKLKDKYASKRATLQERLRRAQQAVDKQAEQAKQAKLQTALSFGSTILGAFTSRRVSSSTISKASTAFRGVGRSIDEGKDVTRANETVSAIQQQQAALETEFNDELAALQEKIDPSTEPLGAIVVKPNKADIIVQLVSLVWLPYWQDAQGNSTPAW